MEAKSSPEPDDKRGQVNIFIRWMTVVQALG